MSGDEPYAEHDGALLLLLILAGLVTVVWLTVRVITGLVRARRNGTALLGPATVLAWDATVGMYTWGLLHLFLLDGHAQSRACEEVVEGRITGYEPTFVPLHFGCRTSDGRVVEAVIPSYLNPATVLLGICALVLTWLVIAHHKKGTHT
jgi:hypothetical protein